MGLLDTVTTLDKTKTTCQISANIDSSKWFDSVQSISSRQWNHLKGYEIHMGNTTGDVGLFKLRRYENKPDSSSTAFMKRGVGGFEILDGSVKDNVWGTYIHGIFDNDGLRTAVLNSLRKKKHLPLQEVTHSYQAKREEAINEWADTLKQSIDICFLLRLVGMEYCIKKLSEELR